jgi:two-component system CheB/CheR fusion protein
MAKDRSAPVSFPIVAVGASAGGLEAFTALLKGLAADTGMGFVLVQHLEPTHKSALSEILSKVTKMPVIEATHGIQVQPGSVYIIPPNKDLTMRDGMLQLGDRHKAPTPYHPIDKFCFSLAKDQGSSAVGILLSGSGSDGTLGLKAIKEEGGITFAQEPKSAQWPIMPESAISAGAVDFVMTPRRIATELARISHHPPADGVPGKRAVNAGEELNNICRLLRTATGVDFRLYKQATVSRRVVRRMAVQKASSLSKYAEILRHNPAEAKALADDIFIHVTGFFRDPECFKALRKHLLSTGSRERRTEDPVRVWVPGCSTGEEAYSLAMLLMETQGDVGSAKIQVFGTDIAEGVIDQARAGIYPEAAMAGVSPQRLKRFFVKDRHRYQIAKAVRDACVFARHDLAKDPPFSRMDLISCRNVLIYMGPALQRRTLSVFQYALKPGGLLFLGKSEAISAWSDMFTERDQPHRIFTRKAGFVAGHRFDSSGSGWTPKEEPPTGIANGKPGFDFHKEAARVLLQGYTPPSLIVDSDLRILHFQGDTSPFLAPATGQPSFHLLKMVRPEFIVDLRALVAKARREGVTARHEGVRYKYEGRDAAVRLDVVPLGGSGVPTFDFLIVFTPSLRGAESAVTIDTGADAGKKLPPRVSSLNQKVRKLEHELASGREYMQSLVGEHETAQEEMKAANEEILSSNEELQSTNEELETAKEELQSSNEELASLNEELQHRNNELALLSSDLKNVLAGVDIPVLLLDSDLRIRRFTPMAERILNLIGTDVGRPFSNIAPNLDVNDWDAVFAEVTDKLQIVEREVRDKAGHWYLLRVRPYKTPDNRIDGVLMALLDIDSVKRSLEQLRQSRNYAESIVETVRESLLVLDAGFKVLAANKTFYRTFKVLPGDTLGHRLFDLGERQWDHAGLRKLLKEILPRDTHFEDFPVHQMFPGIGHRQMLINAHQIHPEGEGPGLILLAIEDVTEKKQAEEDLRRSESTVRALLDSAPEGIFAVKPDRKIVMANRMAETMFGFQPGKLNGRLVGDVVPDAGFPPRKHAGVDLSLTGCRTDGTRFPIEMRVSHMETTEGRLSVVFVADMSDLRHAEEALRESSAIMKAITEGTQTVIVVKDLQGRIVQASLGALEMRLGERDGISSVDRQVLRTQQPQVVEDTVELDHETRTLLVSKSPRLDGFGKVTGLINVAVDITDRKKAESAALAYQKELETLSGRLITAHEDETKFLARELHDVFSQRLAALAMDIAAAQKEVPRPSAPLMGDLRKLGTGVKSLADDLHRMSRQLHPATLDDLGLGAALKDECRMFAEIQKIPVIFKPARVPRLLPEGVALCLYRVAQECLRNIAKHAGARKVMVQLAATAAQIRLSVEDVGDGFHLQKIRKKKRGLGLISMEERVRIINGVFNIESQPGSGTRVEVRVPLHGVNSAGEA